MERVSVIGAGYVGLVTAACLAELGHDVTCAETNPERLAPLLEFKPPFYEPELDDLVRRWGDAGRLRFSGSAVASVADSRFIFLAVQTPSGEDGSADTSFLFAALSEIGPALRPESIIVIKSTVPAGTGDEAAAFLARRGYPGSLVSNPEFLRQGSAVRDFLEPDRVVVGAENPEAAQAITALYQRLEAPTIVTSRRAAEMGKYAANALLATRISFMNEVSAICEQYGVDIEEVANIVGHDARLGRGYLRAGLGWGGSCFPKDVRSLASMARSVGLQPHILTAVDSVNRAQRQRAFSRLREAVLLDGHADPTVCILGLSFKPNTDDLRESPAIDVMRGLLEEGVRVRAHDPSAMTGAHRLLPAATYHESIHEAALGADALLLATEWPQYQKIDWISVREAMRGRTVFDGRNVLDGPMLRTIGFRYASFGRPLPEDLSVQPAIGQECELAFGK